MYSVAHALRSVQFFPCSVWRRMSRTCVCAACRWRRRPGVCWPTWLMSAWSLMVGDWRTLRAWLRTVTTTSHIRSFVERRQHSVPYGLPCQLVSCVLWCTCTISFLLFLRSWAHLLVFVNCGQVRHALRQIRVQQAGIRESHRENVVSKFGL